MPTLDAAVTIDTTNSAVTPAGAAINFSGASNSSTINGAYALILNGGTGGAINLGGAIGKTTPIAGLTVTGAAITTFGIGTTTVAGVTGATSFSSSVTSGTAIDFTGITYYANAQSYTAAAAAAQFLLGFTGTTIFTSNNAALTFATGTIYVPSGYTFQAVGGTGTVPWVPSLEHQPPVWLH